MAWRSSKCTAGRSHLPNWFMIQESKAWIYDQWQILILEHFIKGGDRCCQKDLILQSFQLQFLFLCLQIHSVVHLHCVRIHRRYSHCREGLPCGLHVQHGQTVHDIILPLCHQSNWGGKSFHQQNSGKYSLKKYSNGLKITDFVQNIYSKGQDLLQNIYSYLHSLENLDFLQNKYSNSLKIKDFLKNICSISLKF